MNKSHLAVMSGFLVSLLFGLTFMFMNIALKYTTPVILLAYRFSLAFIILLILKLLNIFKTNFKNKKLFPLILLAMINPVINFFAEANAIRYITTIQVAIYLSLVPIVIVILSRILLKEKTTKIQTILISVSVIGVIISIIDSISNTQSSIIGTALVIATVFTVAFHGILTKHLSKYNYSANEITFVMVTVGFVFFTSTALLNYSFDQLLKPLQYPSFIISFSYLAIGASIIAYGLYNFMYTTISTAATSVFINLTTVVSTIAGVVILNETLSTTQIIGCILIILGVIGTNIIEYKKT